MSIFSRLFSRNPVTRIKTVRDSVIPNNPISRSSRQIDDALQGNFKKGGPVKKTGIYQLHKGERVLNKKQNEAMTEALFKKTKNYTGGMSAGRLPTEKERSKDHYLSADSRIYPKYTGKKAFETVAMIDKATRLKNARNNPNWAKKQPF